MQEYELSTPLGGIRGLTQAGRGPRLLALHGWLDNAGGFRPLARAMGDREWLALDLPGHGYSFQLPEGLPYHFIDWISHVGWVLEAHEDPVVLVGHSMGAGIAPIVAAAYPEKVAAVVMLDGCGPQTSPEEQAPDLLRRGLAASRKNRPISTFARDEGVARIAETRKVPLEAAEILAERGLCAAEAGLFRYRHDPKLQWISRQRLTEGQIQSLLARVVCPALLVRPSRGILHDQASLDGRKRCFAKLAVSEIEGGHHFHLDSAHRLAPILDTWLQQALGPQERIPSA